MALSLRRLLLAPLVLFGGVGAAEAHTHLKSAVPAMGAAVTVAPTELDLTFSEGVSLALTGVAVAGPGGAVATGPAKLGRGGDTSLVVPVTARLTPGTYKVEWHALATDGHKTTGSYSFTVKP